MKGDCNASQQNSSCCPRPAAVGHLTLSSSTINSVLRARPLADYRDHHSSADMHFLLQLLPGQMKPPHPLAAVLHSNSKLLSKISCGEGQGSSLILQIGASGCDFTIKRYSYDSRTPVLRGHTAVQDILDRAQVCQACPSRLTQWGLLSWRRHKIYHSL